MRKTVATAISAALIGLGITGCSGSAVPSTFATTDTASSLHDVAYKVTGTAKTVNITISTANGGTSQQNDLTLPIVNQNGGQGLHMKMDDGQFAYISAQNQDEFGTVTCTIEVDDIPVLTNTSSGAYAIASCSGRV